MPPVSTNRRLTRRALIVTACSAPIAVHAAEPLPVRGDTLTALIYPEPPYLLSAIDPSLLIGTVTTKVMEGLLYYDFDTTVNYNGAFPDPSAGLQRIYWSKAAQRGVPSVAITGYADPDMDRDFEDAQTRNDPKIRWDDYADMQRRAMTDLPLIPLMEMRFITVASRQLINHTVMIDGVVGSDFASVYFAPVS